MNIYYFTQYDLGLRIHKSNTMINTMQMATKVVMDR